MNDLRLTIDQSWSRSTNINDRWSIELRDRRSMSEKPTNPFFLTWLQEQEFLKDSKKQVKLILWAFRLVKNQPRTSFDKNSVFPKLWSFKGCKKANFVHFVSCPIGENLLKDLFWQKLYLFKALKLQKLLKSKLCSICELPAWWKTTQGPLLTKTCWQHQSRNI